MELGLDPQSLTLGGNVAFQVLSELLGEINACTSIRF